MATDMAQDMRLSFESPRKHKVELIKKKDSDQYEIVAIHNPVSFDEGCLLVIRACQQLARENDGITLVAVAGPSGAGKTVFTEKIVNFMPSVAVINMDDYKFSSRVIDGNFDDPFLIDYDKLLEDIDGLKAGKAVQVPIYDSETSSCIGHRTIEAPSTRIVIVEGIYALSEKLRPFTNLRVSLTGGVHFDLVKRVSRDIRLAGQDPEEIIRQISKTIYPIYKPIIEPELQTAHIKVINKFTPFCGLYTPTYILKSTKSVPVDQIKAVLLEDHRESTEETYDIYLLPPGENPEVCDSYLRMRNRNGKYSLVFEEWIIDGPYIISPKITFEVSVRLLGGLMALGYTIPSILKRSSRIFSDGKVCVKINWFEQLNRQYIQVRGRDRAHVKYIADQLGLDGSYVSRTYMEQIQLEKLVNDIMALPDDLKTKLNIDDDLDLTSKEALSRASAERRREFFKRCDGRNAASPTTLPNQGAVTQLNEQISTLNARINDFASQIEELNSKLQVLKVSASEENLALQAEPGNGFAPTSAGNGFAPTSAGNGFASTSAGNGFAPASAGNGSAPASAGNGSAPTSAGNGSAPTSAGNSSAPTSAGNGSGPPSLLVAGSGNGSLNGSAMPTSPSLQLATEYHQSEEALQQVLLASRSYDRISRQLGNLTDLLRENLEQRPPQERADRSTRMVAITLAVGGIGFMLFKTLTSKR